MDSYNLLSKWRKSIKEQKEIEPVTAPLRPDAKQDSSAYEEFISSIEKTAGLDPEKQKKIAKAEKEKEDPSCKIKTACNCLDRSETSLEISEIQEILNKYFASTGETIKLNISGECDLETQKAIMRFQKNTGIECDGCVGDQTHSKMLELKLTEKAITAYVPASDASTVVDDSIEGTVLYSATAGTSGGTISIKSNDPSRPYGYKKEIPAGLYNGVDFSRELNHKDLRIRSQHRWYWGNPVLLKAIKDAADAVSKNFPDQSGKGVATLWSVSSKTGGPKLADATTGRYHNSHQTGLDCDIGFYQATDKAIPGTLNTYTKAQRNAFKKSKKDLHNLSISRLFDMPRNITFLDHLVRNPAIKLVFIDQPIIGAMRRWLEENDTENKFSILLSELKKGKGGKVYEPGMMGHHNHYHVRAEFPPGSPTMKEFKKMRLAATKSEVKYIPVTTKDLNKYSFYFGTVDGRLIDSHNANTEFYGASIQKPIAALAQLIQYKNDSSRRLNDKEIGMLLSYTKDSEGSNRVNRGISPGRWPRSYERGKGASEVGKIDRAILRQILSVFDISNQKFTYGGSNNKQSPLDYYKFLSGLTRMTTGRPKNKAEEDFAEKYGPEMKQVIEALKKRVYAPHIKNGFRSAGITNFWGKGGRASGSLNYGIVIDDEYVLVIYTRFSEEKYGTPGYNKTGSGGEHTGKMFTIIKSLVDKIK